MYLLIFLIVWSIVYQTLRKTLDANGFDKNHTKIVASDGGWGIVNDMNKDSELADIVNFVG